MFHYKNYILIFYYYYCTGKLLIEDFWIENTERAHVLVIVYYIETVILFDILKFYHSYIMYKYNIASVILCVSSKGSCDNEW